MCDPQPDRPDEDGDDEHVEHRPLAEQLEPFDRLVTRRLRPAAQQDEDQSDELGDRENDREQEHDRGQDVVAVLPEALDPAVDRVGLRLRDDRVEGDCGKGQRNDERDRADGDGDDGR